MKVQFILSNNRPGSITRIVADTANVLSRMGIASSVLYPAVDWWDYELFTLHRKHGWKKIRHAAKLVWKTVYGLAFRRTWCGFHHHQVDPFVSSQRFLWTPSAASWDHQTLTVIHPAYLVPGLLRTLRSSNVRFVSGIHVNLEKAMEAPDPEAAAWFRHWIEMERRLQVPRFTTSREAKEAAERLGISIDRLIYGGIDLRAFQPLVRTQENRPLVVTLYCDPNRQKGLEVGLEALRQVRERHPRLELRSIGRLTPEQMKIFHRNNGYLHGEAYVRAVQESDIFVYPSLYDGFPAPPLHAMASGAALVTTSVEGVVDYAIHGENAYLCRPGSAEALSEGIRVLVEQPELRERIRGRGPQTAQRFSIEESTCQLLDFFQETFAATSFRAEAVELLR